MYFGKPISKIEAEVDAAADHVLSIHQLEPP